MAFKMYPENGVPSQFLVSLRSAPGMDVRASAESLASKYGGELIHVFEHAVPGFCVRLSEDAARRMALEESVTEVEQDQSGFLGKTPERLNLSLFRTVARSVRSLFSLGGIGWGLDRIDQSDLPLDGVFSPPNDGSGATVFVIDTGVSSVQELGNRLLPGKSFVPGAASTDTRDCDDHGTPVAVLIGGSKLGVARAATIVPVRVWCGSFREVSALIKGIDWVTGQADLSNGQNLVANISLWSFQSNILNAQVAASIAKGITYVVAAGNETANACGFSPGSAGGVINVGATELVNGIEDVRWTQSNFGTCVDIFAPGVDVNAGILGGGITPISGTSAACPYVAGAAAIFLTANPGTSPPSVKTGLVNAATTGKIRDLQGSPDRLLRVS